MPRSVLLLMMPAALTLCSIALGFWAQVSRKPETPPNGRSVKISNFSIFFQFFSQNFRSLCQFLRFAVRSKIFEKIDLVAAVFLVLKS